MSRLTKRIDFGNGKGTVDISNEMCGKLLTHEAVVRALFEKLAHYEDLEEQGLLLKLPCKVGDTIYYIDDYEIYWDKVYNIDIRKENEEYVFCVGYMDYKADDFGETVFLTKEEAEAKLKELENE